MKRHARAWLLMGLLGPLAAGLVLWLTAYGPGVSRDSVVYIGSARSLAEGQGFISGDEPMIKFPPGYPLFLAIAGLWGEDPATAVPWFHALLFGVNLVLFGWMIYVATEHDLAGTACGTLLLLSSAPILKVHSFAWSEPLFFSFSLTGVLLLASHLAKPRSAVLVAAAASFGFAMVTRYAGVALLPPLVGGLLLLGRGPLARRVRESILALAVACAPLAVWVIRNVRVSDSATGRGVAVHPDIIRHLRGLKNMIHDFLLPVPLPGRVVAAYLGILAVLFTVGILLFCKERFAGSRRTSPSAVIPVVCLLFSAVYVAFLFFCMSFVDARISFIDRLVAPAFVFTVVAFIGVAFGVSRSLRMPAIRWLCIAALLLSIAVNGTRASSWAMEAHRSGQGYAARSWRESETVAFVRSLASGVKVYSNDPLAVRFLAGREAVPLPYNVIRATGEENAHYREELRIVCRDGLENGALVVYFSAIRHSYLPTPEELDGFCGLPVARRLSDGTVYGARNGGGASGAGTDERPRALSTGSKT
jgi:hypothetical protein